jgi:parvulin-like peptidyl-prolyl isomerase
MRRALIALAGASLSIAFAHAALPPQTVVASRGGVQITLADVDNYMQRVPEDKRAATLDSPKRVEALLLSMLLNFQLAKQAEEMKLDQDPEVGNAKDWARVEVLSRLRMQRFMKDIKLPDFEPLAKEEYLGHIEKYSTPGSFEIQRILLSFKDLSPEDAWKRASEIRAEAAAAPERFGEFVDKYSDDPDKAQTHGIMLDPAKDKANKLLIRAIADLEKPGDISGAALADGAYKYQIVKLVSMGPRNTPAFSAVHDQIVAQLKDNFVNAQRRDFIDQLSSQKLTANPEAVGSLSDRYRAQAGDPKKAAEPPAPPAKPATTKHAH